MRSFAQWASSKSGTSEVQSPNCFIFDFDGTLAHSEPAYREAFAHSIRLHTGIEVPGHELGDYWNLPPHEVLGKYSLEMVNEMFSSFEEHYYANHHSFLTPYAGVTELLRAIKDTEAQTAVVSLKPRRAGELELDITGLRPLIDLAVWGDDVARPKPEPEAVFVTLSRLNADPQRTLVIGDSPADIKMGRAAGTRTAAALWCGFGRERLLGEGPDLVFDSPADLLEALIDPISKDIR